MVHCLYCEPAEAYTGDSRFISSRKKRDSGGKVMVKILLVILEIGVSLIAVWLLTFLSFFLHELGHAAGHMLATGDRNWHIRVGWGKQLLNTKKLAVNLIVFDGYFTPAQTEYATKAKLIAMLAGGPAVSMLLFAGFLALKLSGLSFQSDFLADGTVEWFLNYPLYLNLMLFVSSLLPMHYPWGEAKGMASDGLKIFRVLKSRE